MYWNLMPAVSHSNDVGTYSGGGGGRCPRWAYQPSLADLISKYRTLYQKFSCQNIAGRSPLTDCEAAE